MCFSKIRGEPECLPERLLRLWSIAVSHKAISLIKKRLGLSLLFQDLLYLRYIYCNSPQMKFLLRWHRLASVRPGSAADHLRYFPGNGQFFIGGNDKYPHPAVLTVDASWLLAAQAVFFRIEPDT